MTIKGVTYRFRYDAFGRRLEKRRMASTFRFVWDGNVLLHETFKKDNSENTELTTWVFEGFVPTAKLVNGKAYSIISDHLGTPILAVDSEGNEVWNRQLDIYGRVKREIKSSLLGDDVRPFIPFLYQGQYYDFETNLAYNRFRYYCPETGAYISQDPIGLEGGNPNIYAYVGDSNWWVDVFGLDIIVIGEGQKRVNNTARNLRKDGNTVRTITDDWPKELFFNPYDPSKHEQISLEYNREWIKERMNEGYDIYDIGEDGRKSPFYEVEQEEIKKNKYNKHYEYNTETKEKSKVCHN